MILHFWKALSFFFFLSLFFFFFLEKNEWFLLVPERGDKNEWFFLRDEYMALKNLSLIIFFLESSDVDKSFWNKCTKYVWMPQFNKKNLFWVLNKVKNGSKECSKTQNRVNEPWWSWVSFCYLESAEWHSNALTGLHHGRPTPYAFSMHVLRFQVFWKIFSSFVTMKHFPSQLQTLETYLNLVKD